MAPSKDQRTGSASDAVGAHGQIARLHELALRFIQDGDLDTLLAAATSEAVSVAGADRGCVQVNHGDGSGLRLAAQRGLVRPFLEHVATLRTGLGGGAAPGGGRLLVDDVATDAILAGSTDREALLTADVRGLSVTPLLGREGHVVGLLSTLHRAAPELQAAELGQLDRVAELCARAVEHARAAKQPSRPLGDAEIAEKLQQTEELFRNTVENMPVNMVLVDRDRRVLYLNPALAEMVKAVCGLTRADIVGRSGKDIWPPAIWTPLETSIQRAIATGQRQTYELATLLSNGEPHHRHWNVIPLAGPDARVHRVLALSQDVTAQRRLVDELREADRRKSEFIGVLSHELRNPLAAIRAGLHVLERGGAADDDDDERARARLEAARGVINRQVGHLVRMVDDLLDVTRISQNKIHLQRRHVDLARLVGEAIEDNRPQVEARGVQLEATLPPSPLFASVDGVRIAQVVTNLLSNAAKFTPSGGSAAVSLHEDGGSAILTVADTGSGIDGALLPRVFDPFVQAEGTLDRAAGGLGLGLALVKGLVELHGGQVTASSPGAARGSTFVVRLPLEARTGVGPSAAAAAARRPRRALVIEDDRDVAQALQLALEIDGHTVAVAYDGISGLELARAFTPDVVLCDIGLPGLDGYQVARAVRADPNLRGIYLIAISGYAQAADRERARGAGFDEHLAKPASMETIQALLSR